MFSIVLNIDKHDYDNAEEEDQILVGSSDNWQPLIASPDWQYFIRANDPHTTQ